METIVIAPSSKQIPTRLPEEKIRQIKLQLFQGFLSLVMKRLINASFTVLAINGSIYLPLVALFVANQPGERTVLCLKRRDSDMDCTHCGLQSIHRSSQTSTTSTLQYSSSDDNADRSSSSHISISNTKAQMSIARHHEFDPALTVRHQLFVASHHFHRYMNNIQLATSTRNINAFSAHDLLPALYSFEGLCLTPFNLYLIVSFDKFHIFDLAITRNFWPYTRFFATSLQPTSVQSHDHCKWIIYFPSSVFPPFLSPPLSNDSAEQPCRNIRNEPTRVCSLPMCLFYRLVKLRPQLPKTSGMCSTTRLNIHYALYAFLLGREIYTSGNFSCSILVVKWLLFSKSMLQLQFIVSCVRLATILLTRMYQTWFIRGEWDGA